MRNSVHWTGASALAADITEFFHAEADRFVNGQRHIGIYLTKTYTWTVFFCHQQPQTAIFPQAGLYGQRYGQGRIIHTGYGIVTEIAYVLRRSQDHQRIVGIPQSRRGTAERRGYRSDQIVIHCLGGYDNIR